MPKKKFNVTEALEILAIEVKDYQVPVVDLIQAQTREPWKVLVATIMSARTKDEVTAEAARRLFAKCETVFDLEKLTEAEIETIIKPVGFFKNKAKYLRQLPIAIREMYDGQIPDEIDDLVKLPGVGRKTANLVRAVAFNLPAICVDTHVHRIMNIWGYVDTKNPLETEMALRNKLPQKYWIPVNSVLVSWGQSVCRPVSPHCDECPFNETCPKNGVTPRKKVNNKVKEKMRNKGLKLISWNVNGIRAVAKKNFFEFLQEESPDVLAIQETKAQKDQLDETLTAPDGYHTYWFDAQKKGYSGVAIFSKKEPKQVIYGLQEEEFDHEGRAITVEYEDFYLVNCYFPNSQDQLARLDYKIRFFDKIQAHCAELAKTKTVALCGDYNVAHTAIDLANPKRNEKNPGYAIEERDAMTKFLDSGFVDTFRMFNTNPEQYTWWSYRFRAREKNIGWRIDYFCVDEKSRTRVSDAAIYAQTLGSDHCPVALWLRPAE